MQSDLSRQLNLGHFVSNKQIVLQFSSSTISDFDQIFIVCALMYWNMLCKILQQYSEYSFFCGILKASWVTLLSRLNLLPCSASRNSTIIVDKLMKFAGHLIMVLLIEKCGLKLMKLSWSCLNLLPYSVGQKSTIIADKLMKIAGHLVMVVLIKDYWQNSIWDRQFSSNCRLKMKKHNDFVMCQYFAAPLSANELIKR